MSGSFDDLADQLAAISAALDERSFELLREAARAGTGRPAEDKRLMQARRAIDKAERLLRDPAEDRDGEAGDEFL